MKILFYYSLSLQYTILRKPRKILGMNEVKKIRPSVIYENFRFIWKERGSRLTISTPKNRKMQPKILGARYTLNFTVFDILLLSL